jgi:hypothetical protein
VTSGVDEGNPVAEGRDVAFCSVYATFEQNNAASDATLTADKAQSIDRLIMPASETDFPATEVAQPPSLDQ